MKTASSLCDFCLGVVIGGLLLIGIGIIFYWIYPIAIGSLAIFAGLLGRKLEGNCKI